MPLFRNCLLVILVLLLAGCSSMRIEDFAGTEPKFVLEEYFTGKTRAWGVVYSRSGELIRQFTVDLVGTWKDGELTLVEDFVFTDGEISQRTWYIRKLDEHRYEGRAADVVGTAEGVSYGQALRWRYVLNLKVDGETYKVNFDDWMFMQPDQVLFNRAEFSKFGFKLGEVVLYFRK